MIFIYNFSFSQIAHQKILFHVSCFFQALCTTGTIAGFDEDGDVIVAYQGGNRLVVLLVSLKNYCEISPWGHLRGLMVDILCSSWHRMRSIEGYFAGILISIVY